MTGNALGFIETIGLTAAIEAADSAAKSANVRILGYELAKGDGMAAVKIEGDVGAVKAAVKAAEAAAGKVGRVVSVHVIPRPAEGTEQIVRSRETVGSGEAKKTAAPRPVQVPPETPQIPAGPAQTQPETAQPAGELRDAEKPKSQSRKSKTEGSVKPKPDSKDPENPSLGLDNN